MHNFRSLDVWKDAMNLTLLVYRVSEHFPADEKFGLKSQIQRCAVSIPSNIAEGAGRNTNKEFNQFLAIATGSSYELETQLLLARELEYIEEEKLNELMNRLHTIQKRLYRFKQSLQN